MGGGGGGGLSKSALWPHDGCRRPVEAQGMRTLARWLGFTCRRGLFGRGDLGMGLGGGMRSSAHASFFIRMSGGDAISRSCLSLFSVPPV